MTVLVVRPLFLGDHLAGLSVDQIYDGVVEMYRCGQIAPSKPFYDTKADPAPTVQWVLKHFDIRQKNQVGVDTSGRQSSNRFSQRGCNAAE